MSHVATAWAYRQRVMSAGRKFVLVALADFADEAWSCYPGQDRLAAMTGQSVRSVREHLARLETDGLIARAPRYALGRRTSDRYLLRADLPADLAGTDYRQISPSSPADLAGYPLENHQTPLTPRKRGERAHCPKHARYRSDCVACGRTARPTLTAVPATADPRCPTHDHELAAGCRACAADRKAGNA